MVYDGRSQSKNSFSGRRDNVQMVLAFLRVDNELHRCRCKLTGESIPDPQHEIGQQCPLIFQDKEE